MHIIAAVVAVEPLSIDIVIRAVLVITLVRVAVASPAVAVVVIIVLAAISSSSLLPSTSIFAHLPMSVQFSYLFAIQSTHFTYELFICVAFAIMIICGFCVLESLAVALHAHDSDDFFIFVVSVDESDVTASR